MNSMARYGLENLNNVQDARSDGLTRSQKLRPTMIAPVAIAVYKYTSWNMCFPEGSVMKNGSTLKRTIIRVVPAMTRTDVFSD